MGEGNFGQTFTYVRCTYNETVDEYDYSLAVNVMKDV